MIIKDWSPPYLLRQLQALHRRLPPHHLKYPLVKEHLLKATAGYKGEESIKYPLTMLDEKKNYIFHDIRLAVEKQYVQFDVLVFSKSYMVIIEVKNIIGTLFFDHHFHQMIRTLDGKEEGFANPLLQLNRQHILMKKWMAANHLPEIPVIPLIVISNPQTIVKSSDPTLSQMIIHRNYIPLQFQQLEKDNKELRLSTKDVKKMIRSIGNQHTPLKTSILEKYQIRKKDLIKGVHCPECEHLPLSRLKGRWQCLKCGTYKREAIATLQDYVLLIAETITNSELREFFLIDSTASASRILQSLNVESTGTRKNKVYSLK